MIKKSAKIGFVFALALLLISCSSLCAAPAGKLIRSVRIEGNQTVGTGYVLAHIDSKEATEFSETVANEDAKRIVLLPEIVDVRWGVEEVEGNQVDVVFVLQEAARIKSIELAGNQKYKDAKLLKKIDIVEGDFVDMFRVNEAARVLKEYYRGKGYYYIDVDYNRELLEEDGRLVYVVMEGPRLKVRGISFTGNQSFSDRKLRGKIHTKKYFPIFVKGKLEDQQLEDDRYAVATFYHDEGFLDARVFYDTAFNEERTSVEVNFVVEEGTRYKIGQVRIEGNQIYDTETLRAELVKLDEGIYLTKERETRGQRALREYYGRAGYIYASVRPEREFTEAEGVINLVYQITEGGQFTLNRLLVKGNATTKDKVVRREFDYYGFQPGRLYNTEAMEKARRRLRGRMIFEDVTVNPVGEEENTRDALVEVTEGHTGMMLFGVGYDTDNGVIGQFTIEQRNFDIANWPTSMSELLGGDAFVGAGQKLRFEAMPGKNVNRGRIVFTEPYLFDQLYYLEVQAHLFRRWRESWKERRAGGMVTVGRRFENDWSVDVSLRGEQVKISDLDEGYETPGDKTTPRIIIAPQDVQDVAGGSLITSVKFGVGRDTTDSMYRPTEGYRINSSVEQVGALGGDYDFTALRAGARYFYPLYEDLRERRTVLVMRANGSYIVGDAPMFERYYAGGIGSIRGFDYRGISPRDGRGNDPIGSDYLYLAGMEIIQPIHEEVLYGKIFCDSAYIDSGSMRLSVGFGFELVVPQLFQEMPISVDFGIPINSDDEDDEEIFSFSFGMNF